MKITLASMLAQLSLDSGELAVLKMTLLVLAMIVGMGLVALALFGIIWLMGRMSGPTRPPAGPSAQPLPTPSAAPSVSRQGAKGGSRIARKRALSILLGLLVVGGGTVFFAIAMHRTPAGDSLSAAEFNQLLNSNRITAATVFHNPGSSDFKITGSYEKGDGAGGKTVTPFITPEIVLTDKALERLESLPEVTMVEKNAIVFSVIATFLPLLLVLVFVCLVVFVIVRLAFGKRSNPEVPPPTQPTSPFPSSPRQCPKCGTLLKADVPEGLCPACLLQHAFATEGGAPPGTPAFTPPPLAELAKLFPQLEILEAIGQGGMGAVYKARQPALDRFVALKILAPRSGGDLDFAGRFSREARALAKLSHPNIVAVYDYGTVGQASSLSPSEKSGDTPETGRMPVLHYFIMEFVDGPNLRQVEQAGKLSPREALQIIPQICAALQFAHDEGIVHRDIKPENVLLDKKGRVKIADFGLAKILGQDADFRLTGARDVMGTPHYMAPEQVEKPQEVDHRADIYSLGVVFYEMLTGELPIGKFDPPSHKVQIDVRLDDVVLRSLANNPDRRYQHVSEVKTELESIAGTSAPQTAAPRSNPIHEGVDYRSEATLFGLPLVHITSGVDPETGKVRVSKGIIALGGRAQGVLAIGGLATGAIAIGGCAIGVVAFGGAALGLFSFGGMAIALLFAIGGGAIAPIALGGGALGYMVLGGGGMGAHLSTANIHDPAAQQFFGLWGPACLTSIQYINGLVVIVAVGLGVGAPLWARRRGNSSNTARVVDAIRAWLAVMDRGDYARSWELAATYFQQAMKKEDWISKGESIRRPLSSVLSRQLQQTRLFAGGMRFEAKFKTSFDGLLNAVETVTFAQHGNGDWKAIGYLIKPAFSRIARWLWVPVAALFIGLLLVVGLVFWVWPSHSTAPNSSSVFTRLFANTQANTDFHYEVFECDAALVNKLIPDVHRQNVVLPARESTLGKSQIDAEFAIVDSSVLAELEKSVTTQPGILADHHRTVYSPFWDPGMADTWSYAHSGYFTNGNWRGGSVGGAGGSIGVRRVQGRLQIHVNMRVNHTIPSGSTEPGGHLDSQIFYEGPTPTGALVFLVPFVCQDRSEHYLVIAYQITDLSSGNASPTIQPTTPGSVIQPERSPFPESVRSKELTTNASISPEEQVALIEIERAKALAQDNPVAKIQPPTELSPAAVMLAQQPPVVVETFPVAGTRNVPAGETEIRVRFSKPMQDGSWSWSTAWQNSTPEIIGTPHYLDDGRTCVLQARLEPERTYAWWLNSDTFHNFRDQAGRSAVPYLLIFQTKPN